MKRLGVLLLVLATTTIPNSTSEACSFPAPVPYQINNDLVGVDVEPPGQPRVGLLDVQRAEKETFLESCTAPDSPCGSSVPEGSIVLVLDDVTEDGQPVDTDTGYIIDVVEGNAPPALRLPFHQEFSEATLLEHTDGAPNIFLSWADAHEPSFSFTLAITATDRAGNLSKTTFVVISDPDGPSGCATSPGRSGSVWIFLGLLMMISAMRARQI